MRNLTILAIFTLLLVLSSNQVSALEEYDFIYNIEVGKTYTWKLTRNFVVPDKYSLEYEETMHIHSKKRYVVEYTYRIILIGGDIDSYNSLHPWDNLYKGHTTEWKDSQDLREMSPYFMPINDEYPSYYQEHTPEADFTENLFSYTIFIEMQISYLPLDLSGNGLYEETIIYTKDAGLMIYKIEEIIFYDPEGVLIQHYQFILEYQGIERFANPRILGLTLGFSFLILGIIAVLLYHWRKRKKSKLR